MLHAGVVDRRRGDFRTNDFDVAAATSSDQACARGPGAYGNNVMLLVMFGRDAAECSH
jgi:hypothetical protein